MSSETDRSSDSPPDILAPVNALEEVEPLLEAGADWLYGGILPPEWGSRYPSTVLLNQRTFASAQFSSMSEMEGAVRSTRDVCRCFALTLNAPFYMDEQIPLVLDLVRWAAGSGVSALIVADPGLIVRIREEEIDIPLHLSTMGLGTNHLAVGLFEELGVTRVILPRFLTVGQISRLVGGAPGVEYEAFILVGRCPNIEGVCTFLHDSPSGRWPCEWRWTLTGTDGGPPPKPVAAHFEGMKAADRRQGCGLCDLPDLMDAGVGAFKIVGRGAPLFRKVSFVRQVRRLAEVARRGPGTRWVEECSRVYEELFGHPCSLNDCYYPSQREGK